MVRRKVGRTVPWKRGASEPGRQHPLWLQGERGDNGSQVRRQTQIASTTSVEIKLKPGRHAGHIKCRVDKEPEAEGLWQSRTSECQGLCFRLYLQVALRVPFPGWFGSTSPNDSLVFSSCPQSPSQLHLHVYFSPVPSFLRISLVTLQWGLQC